MDTNVLVSAFVARGLCADVLEVVLTEHELVVGEVVLEELSRILAERRFPAGLVDEAVRFLSDLNLTPKPTTHLHLGLRDGDDEWIVASAMAGRADLLVTGDADLLAERERLPLAVVSPRESWWVLHVR